MMETREEIVEAIRSQSPTLDRVSSKEVIESLFNGSNELLIDFIRAAFSLLAARIVGHDNIVKNTPEIHDQWVAAIRELSEAHLDSVKQGSIDEL